MTYEKEVLQLLQYYPSVSFNRLHVDAYMFGGTGTGFTWDKGQLVNIFRPNRKKPGKISMKKARQRFEDYSYSYKKCMGRKSNEKFDRENSWILEMFEELGMPKDDYSNLPEEDYMVPSIDGENEFQIEAFTEYSPIANIPDDIQDDFREALLHFCEFCIEHQEILGQPVKVFEDTIVKLKR